MKTEPCVFFLAPAACAALLLAGCEKTVLPILGEAPSLPPHLGPPPAATCVVSPFQVRDGGTADIKMTVSNDGGFCAATLTANSGAPYDAPLVPEKPVHGQDSVVQYNRKTSVEYVATSGYVGRDSFVVRLIVKGKPGFTTLNMTVDVQPVAPAGARSS